MDLKQRAQELKNLGFLPPDTDTEELAREVLENEDVDPLSAPATALLSTAGVLLEVPCDPPIEEEDIEVVFEALQDMLDGVIELDNIEVEVLSESDDDEEEIDEDADTVVAVSFTVDGKAVEYELRCMVGMIDLSFMEAIEDALEAKGDSRRLCPIVELMDDTSRYVFVDPAKMEEAELREVIEAPDFEEE